MRNAPDTDSKWSIYFNGPSDSSLSLEALSENAAAWYGQSPMYNIYRAGFERLGNEVENDVPRQFDSQPVDVYANTTVNDLFYLDIPHIEAEAALVMNVAMAFWGSLWQILDGCRVDDQGAMTEALDKAAAYWVGADQVKGDQHSGYFFYSAAQFIGGKFNQNQADSEVEVNTLVLAELGMIQQAIASNTCVDRGGYQTMRNRVKKLTGYLNRVLMQFLLFRIETATSGQNTNFVELYMLSLIPQISACDPDAYYDLIDTTITSNVDATTKDQVIARLQSVYSCLHITCTDVGALEGNLIPACNDNPTTFPTIERYPPRNDMRSFLAMDRDILQIGAMMEYEAYTAAKDFFDYGWNGVIAFGDIASNEFLAFLETTPDFQAIADYYQGINGDNLYDMVDQIFRGDGVFATAPTTQKVGMVDGFLKGLMFLALTGVVEEALQACRDGDIDNANKHWDEAVSFLVGSTEGSQEGGAVNAPGVSLWGLADAYCEFFDDCAPKDAEVNERLIGYFLSSTDALNARNCDAVTNTYSQNIREDLVVGMVQATLYSYIQWSQSTSEASGFAYGLSRVLLPVLASEIPNGSGLDTVLSDLDTSTNYAINQVAPDSTGVISLFGYFSSIYDALPWDCRSLGAIMFGANQQQLQVCTSDVPLSAPPPPTLTAPTLSPSILYSPPTRAPAGTPKDQVPPDSRGLAWGRYEFVDENWAKNDAAFALDIEQMWTATTLELGLSAYTAGTSVLNGLSGNPTIKTLQEMSSLADTVMNEDMMFNFYRYARYEDADFDASLANADPWPYGDTVVTLALDATHGDDVKLAAEATIAMNMWMMIIHQLYEAERACETGSDAPKYVDSAVGLWIGEKQGEGLFETGYSLYSLAQDAHKLFGNPVGESPANANLMELFNAAQAAAKSCTGTSSPGNPSSPRAKLRARNEEVIKGLSLPLLQMLLYYMSVQDTNFIELFSLSFVPQMITCNVDEFDYVSGELFQAKALQDSDDIKLKLLRNLAAGLSCLRYTCAEIGDVSNASESLQIIVQDICEDMDNDFDQSYLASYPISEGGVGITEINELSRLDLDLHQIEILMKANALSNARQIFEYGRNSRAVDYAQTQSLMTLQRLSADPIIETSGLVYEGFDVVSFVTSVFDNSDPQYGSAPRLAKAEVVVRSIQTYCLYANIMARIQQALNSCDNTGSQAGYAASLVDQAAALFVGSIEGSTSGGSDTNSGTMLLSLGKEICPFFSETCASHGDAVSNEFIMFSFASLQTWLLSNNCASASNILNTNFQPMVPVPLIQATLKFAYDASLPGSNASSRAAADIIGRSIIPLVRAVSPTSANTLGQSISYQSVNFDQVVDVITNSLRGMGVDCNAIGVMAVNGVSTCSDTEAGGPPPAVGTPTELGDGKYTATTYVQDRADIAKDIEQMQNALNIKNINLATEIYSDGENSAVYDDVGTQIGTRSFEKFSIEASTKMTTNPLYQATLYGLRGTNDEYLGAPVGQYADSIVKRALADGSDFAIDAVLALNLWMETANELFQMVSNCKNQELKDDDGVHSIDEAAAYWLGDAKTDSQVDHGHLLYNLAEKMAAQFGTVGSNGQAVANTNLLQLLHAAKLELTYPDACSENMATVRRLRHVVNQAVSQMMVPLVQGLVGNIITGDRDRVNIYAHAVVPQLVTCSPHAYEYLMTKLIRTQYAASEEDAIVLKLQSVYDCLGITCADIGTHQDQRLDIECKDNDGIQSLSGYRTRTDAGEYAQMDLDIQELDVLMAMGAYEAAEELYLFGRHAQSGADNSRVSLSLQSLAIDTGRSDVASFRKFRDYYGEDVNYADTIMTRIFDTSVDMSTTHRRYVAVATAQYMIVYMATLQAMQDALKACENGGQELGASEHWDRAAAFIIGHMEGIERAGSNEGRLLWGLAKTECVEWGTCSEAVQGNAVANERIRTLLYTGRGAITGSRRNSCPGLKNAAKDIERILLGPLLQATLGAIARINEFTGLNRTREHAKAHALANALLPYIHDVSRDAASKIQSNLALDRTPLADGASQVVKMFTQTMDDMGVDCRDVGVSPTVDACSGEVSDGKSPLIILVIAILIVATLAIAGLAYLKLSKRRKKESPPVFIPNDKGELSHDQVIESAPSSRRDAEDTAVYHDADANIDDDYERPDLPETV
jgi:hypothetical protein